ncbi:MAG: hypothetical protein IIY71_01460 [Oscillospiraceae bacterium]|nr:hypothetical protein [Oscillospiraceae bacterium]
MISILIRSLTITLTAELLAAVILGLRETEALTTVLLMNLITNPPAAYLITLARKFWAPQTVLVVLLTVEGLVWLIEAAILHRQLAMSKGRAAMCSAVLNGVSYGVGLLL